MGTEITKPEGRAGRLKLIEQALQDQAPLLYSLLVRGEHITQFLEAEEVNLMNHYKSISTDLGIESIIKEEDPDTTTYIHMALRRIKHPWLQAVETCLCYQDITHEQWMRLSSRFKVM